VASVRAHPSVPARLLRTAATLAVVAGLAVGAAACGGDDDAGDGGSDPSLIPPETTDAEPTDSEPTPSSADTTASTPASTEPSRPTAFTGAARDAVNELKAAWEAGDRGRAATIAPGAVVEALFVVPPDGFEIQGCDTGEFDTSTCTFRNRSTEAFIVVAAIRSDAGWQIDTIDVNAD